MVSYKNAIHFGIIHIYAFPIFFHLPPSLMHGESLWVMQSEINPSVNHQLFALLSMITNYLVEGIHVNF